MPAEEATRYSLHSFRIGSATAMFAAGAPIGVVQRAGRWATASSADLYARTSEQLLAAPMAALAACPAHGTPEAPARRGRGA